MNLLPSDQRDSYQFRPSFSVEDPSHEVQAQRQKVRAAETRLADTRELLGLEIDRSWDELQAASATVRVAEAAVEQAEVNPDEESDRLVLRPKVRDVAR
jgi:outer membrane protein TolC